MCAGLIKRSSFGLIRNVQAVSFSVSAISAGRSVMFCSFSTRCSSHRPMMFFSTR
ncbi:hypothetical protein D3C76_1809020 [compost metagenome]